MSNVRENFTCQEGAACEDSDENYRKDFLSEKSDESYSVFGKLRIPGKKHLYSKILQHRKRHVTQLHIGKNITIRVPDFGTSEVFWWLS